MFITHFKLILEVQHYSRCIRQAVLYLSHNSAKNQQEDEKRKDAFLPSEKISYTLAIQICCMDKWQN